MRIDFSSGPDGRWKPGVLAQSSRCSFMCSRPYSQLFWHRRSFRPPRSDHLRSAPRSSGWSDIGCLRAAQQMIFRILARRVRGIRPQVTQDETLARTWVDVKHDASKAAHWVVDHKEIIATTVYRDSRRSRVYRSKLRFRGARMRSPRRRHSRSGRWRVHQLWRQQHRQPMRDRSALWCRGRSRDRSPLLRSRQIRRQHRQSRMGRIASTKAGQAVSSLLPKGTGVRSSVRLGWGLAPLPVAQSLSAELALRAKRPRKC